MLNPGMLCATTQHEKVCGLVEQAGWFLTHSVLWCPVRNFHEFAEGGQHGVLP